MSTTMDLDVAASYSLRDPRTRTALFFKIKTTSFMDRGVSIEFLSAFPGEKEYLCTCRATHGP